MGGRNVSYWLLARDRRSLRRKTEDRSEEEADGAYSRLLSLAESSPEVVFCEFLGGVAEKLESV
jgi:hypothetical protein